MSTLVKQLRPMDDGQSTGKKASWQHDLLLSFLLHSWVQETVGGMRLGFRGRSWSRSVLLQLRSATRKSHDSHAWFLHFFSSFLGHPGWRAEVIHKLMCLSFCPALSRVFSTWWVTIQGTAKPYLLFFIMVFFIMFFFIYFFSSRCCWWEGWEQP